MSSIGERGAEMEITYDDVENEWRPGQLGDSWKQLEASCGVTVVADRSATKEGGSVDEPAPQTGTVKLPCKRKGSDSSDGDLLSQLWAEDRVQQQPPAPRAKRP